MSLMHLNPAGKYSYPSHQRPFCGVDRCV